MTVRIEKSGSVWTVILSRPEARNAMNPKSADALQEAFLEFEKEESASVAVFWGEGGAFCAGWDLKHAASLEGDRHWVNWIFLNMVILPEERWGQADWNWTNQ